MDEICGLRPEENRGLCGIAKNDGDPDEAFSSIHQPQPVGRSGQA